MEDRVCRLSDGADWKKTNSFERGYLKDTAYDASKVVAKADKYGNAVDKVLVWLDLDPADTERSPRRPACTRWPGTRATTTSARATACPAASRWPSTARRSTRPSTARPLPACTRTPRARKGLFGEASYEANAKAEATASVDANAHLDSNGLTATVGAKAPACRWKPPCTAGAHPGPHLGGTELFAASRHRARLAQVSGRATGNVTITRHPPTAVVSGTAGVSAAAKVEGEIRASAGPFTIVGSAYASAGAEARATGILGYEDGKLKIGGSIGAALGVGAGAGVTVEIDVAQIGEMAKDIADVNNDGKLGIDDAFAAAGKVASWFGFGAPERTSVSPQALRIAPGGFQVGGQQYQYRPYLMNQWTAPSFVPQRKEEREDRRREAPGVH